MELADQIRAWLEDGCYLDGVALYRRTGGAYPVRTFEGYEHAPYVPEATERLLRAALLDHLATLPPPPPEAGPLGEADIEELVPVATGGRSQAGQEPDGILRLRLEARLLHKRHALLHARLYDEPEEEKRYELAEEIMETLIPGLDSIYDSIRNWQATGELPLEAKPDGDVVQDTVRKMQRIQSLASRISRLKGALKKKLPDSEAQAYQKELAEKQVEKKRLETELGLG